MFERTCKQIGLLLSYKKKKKIGLLLTKHTETREPRSVAAHSHVFVLISHKQIGEYLQEYVENKVKSVHSRKINEKTQTWILYLSLWTTTYSIHIKNNI